MLCRRLRNAWVLFLFTAVLAASGCGDDSDSPADSEMQKRIEEAEARCEEDRASGCWPGDEQWEDCVKVYADLCNPGYVQKSCPGNYVCRNDGAG